MKLAFCFSLLFIVSSMNLSMGNEIEERSYCLSQGGEIRTMEMLNDQHVPIGIEKEFCLLRSENEGTKFISFSTLYSKRETLAHRTYEKGCREGESTVVSYQNPSAPFCTQSGGIYSKWRDKTDMGETGFCAFADGSSMCGWLLCYGKGRLPNMTKKMRYYQE